MARMGREVCSNNTMKYIGYQDEERAEKWARKYLGVKAAPSVFRALAAVDDKGEFACVILLTNFTKRNVDINIVSACLLTPKSTIMMFNGLFKMVFDELKAVRTTALVAESNIACHKFCKHLGLIKEGVMREAYDDNENMHIYGFLNSEYKKHDWYRG
tara:strand:- start:170 stop:643 length:474 start_codon:yes stop_codon:yes gene_type:complete